MTSREHLKIMVMQFRVVDLKTLLDFAGCKNVNLRKKELRKKAVNLVTRKWTSALAHQVHSIYLQMNNRSKKQDSMKRRSSLDFLFHNYFEETKNSHSSTNRYNLDSRSQISPYSSLFKKLDLTKLNSIKFTNLSFFEYLSDIMLVTPLTPIREKNDLFEYNGTFTLTERIIEHLLYDNSETNPQYQILLRICLLNDETDVVDCLPPKLYVTVNDKYCSLPPPDPSVSKQTPVMKRISAPINITGYLNKDLFINTLVVHWAAQFYTCYGITVQFVKRRPANELIQKLKERGEQDPSVSKKIIFNNLNDGDNEIAATSLKMSLICPLGKMLMSLPSRGSTCNHLQCFDGCLYIKMNEIKSTWQCPVCNQTCLFENLFVDGYFMDILRSEKFTPNVTDIQLNADGSWESVTPTNGRRSQNDFLNTPAKEKREYVSLVENLSEKSSDNISKLEKNSYKKLKVCNSVEESSAEADGETSPLINGSLVDDLRHFLFPYDNFDVSNNSLQRHIFNDPPTLDFMPLTDSLSCSSAEFPESPPLLSEPSGTSLNRKNVILVDLTESDSESDDIKSTNSVSEDSNNSFLNTPGDSFSRTSPPVYDIDSDSS